MFRRIAAFQESSRVVTERPLRILNLPENKMGRDFVVGDLHGHIKELWVLLDYNRFDESTDRVICCGDLVDRGPSSLGAAELLNEPWFYSIMGNHEEMLLDFLNSKNLNSPTVESWLKRDGVWTSDLNEEDKERLCDSMEKLPHILIVGSGKERYHVVHAELMREDGGLISDAWIDSLESGMELYKQISRFVWGRTLLKMTPARSKEHVGALSRTFCGHSIVKDVTLKGSHYFIDTGAFTPLGSLTCVDISNNSYASYSEKNGSFIESSLPQPE